MQLCEENFLMWFGTALDFGVCCVCGWAHMKVTTLFLPRVFLAFNNKYFQQGSILSLLNFPSFWQWWNLTLVLYIALKEEIEIWREIWRMWFENKEPAHAIPPVKQLCVFMSLWVCSSAPSCSEAVSGFFCDSWDVSQNCSKPKWVILLTLKQLVDS
jgi:hypothetical protein